MSATAPDDAARFVADELPRLVGALELYVGDRLVAEELAQEALVRAFGRWEHVRTLESPGGWTWRVAMNLANSHFRRRKIERRAMARRAPAAVVDDIDGAADREVVRAAVAALPSKQRAAVVLRYFCELSSGDAARVLSCSPEAVRALTSRALKQLRADLGNALEAPVEEARDG